MCTTPRHPHVHRSMSCAQHNREISFDEWVTHYKVELILSMQELILMPWILMVMALHVSREEFVDYHREFFLSSEDKLDSSISWISLTVNSACFLFNVAAHTVILHCL